LRLFGCDIDANDFIDAVPILAVVGCYAQGMTKIFNVTIARAKECDRITAIAAAGATVIEDAQYVKKSYPAFYSDLKSLGGFVAKNYLIDSKAID